MKVKKRDYTLGVRLKDHERDYLTREARERGQRLSDYIRDVLLASAPRVFLPSVK